LVNINIGIVIHPRTSLSGASLYLGFYSEHIKKRNLHNLCILFHYICRVIRPFKRSKLWCFVSASHAKPWIIASKFHSSNSRNILSIWQTTLREVPYGWKPKTTLSARNKNLFSSLVTL